MAGELQLQYSTGLTVYFHVRDRTAQIWNTVTPGLEAYLTANIANYKIAGTEQGTASGFYTATFPAAAAGVYHVSAYKQAGGSPAESDPVIGDNVVQWNGSALIPLNNLPVNVTQLLGTAWLTPAVAGTPDVNAKQIGGAASVGTAGYVGLDWAQITNKTTTNALTGTTISTSQTITSVSGSVGSVTGNVGGISGVTFPTNFASLSIDTNGRVAIQSGLTKNVALSNFEFLMVLSSDHVTGATGLSVTAQRSIDGAAFANCTNSVSELANGMYTINLSASDLNGVVISLKMTASGADTRFITLTTTP